MRSSLPWIKEWVQLMLDGKPIPPIRRASLGVNFSQEAELPLLKGGAKKVVVCTSANRELGSMEVTDGDAFISVYLPPDVQDKVAVEDDCDLGTLSGTLIRLDKWIFSSVIMAASMSQQKDQTIPLCIQAHAISVIGRDDTDFLMSGRRIVDINEDIMVKERLGWMTHGMLVSKMIGCQNLRAGLPNCEGHGIFHADPYEQLGIGETRIQRLRQQCPPFLWNEFKDLRERGTCEDEYHTQEPYESLCPSHEDWGTGGSQPETYFNTLPLTHAREVESEKEHSTLFSSSQQPYNTHDEYTVARYLAESISTPPKGHSNKDEGIDGLTTLKENVLGTSSGPKDGEDDTVSIQSPPSEDLRKNTGEIIERGPTGGSTSFSSMESVSSPDNNEREHSRHKRSYPAFDKRGPFSEPGTTSALSQSEKEVSEQQRDGTVQDVTTNPPSERDEDGEESSSLWQLDSPHRLEQWRKAVIRKNNDPSSSGVNVVAEEQPIFAWERAPSDFELQQQRKQMTNLDYTTTYVPSAGMGGTKRCQNDDEGPIEHDMPQQFERIPINSKKKNSSDSSMNFLISVFLAGPEAILRPERNSNKEDVQSFSSLLPPLENNNGNALTNNPSIAFFLNPKLGKSAASNTVSGTRREESGSPPSLVPPLNKTLHEQFLIRPTDLPDPRTKLPRTDISKYKFLQNWFEYPRISNPIYNSIYRLGLG